MGAELQYHAIGCCSHQRSRSYRKAECSLPAERMASSPSQGRAPAWNAARCGGLCSNQFGTWAAVDRRRKMTPSAP